MPKAEKTLRRRVGRGGKYAGLVARKVVTATGEDLFGAFEELAASGTSAVIAEYEATAKQILRKAGLPTEYPGAYDLPGGGRGILTALLKDQGLEPTGRAAEILRYAHVLKDAMSENDTSGAVWAALRLQREIDFLNLAPWELLARKGEASASGSDKGGKGKMGKTKVRPEKLRAAVSEALRTHKHWKLTDARKHVAKMFFLSLRTVTDHTKTTK